MHKSCNKNDLRVIKTHKILVTTLFELMRNVSFAHITVNKLCKEAQVSRATFYSHFNDKYDLLKYSLKSIAPFHFSEDDIETIIFNFIKTHQKIIKNLLSDADDEVFDIFRTFVPSLAGISVPDNPKDRLRYDVLSRILTGGIFKYLTWLVRSPPADAAANTFFFEFLRVLHNSYKEHIDKDESDNLTHRR